MSKLTKTPNPIDIQVGNRIRLARTMLHMSQERLGESVGITFQQIQKYEKGTNRVGASRLQAISNVLGQPVSFFFEGAGCNAQPREPSEVSAFLHSKEGIELAQAFALVKDPAARAALVNAFKVSARLAARAEPGADPLDHLHRPAQSSALTTATH